MIIATLIILLVVVVKYILPLLWKLIELIFAALIVVVWGFLGAFPGFLLEAGAFVGIL